MDGQRRLSQSLTFRRRRALRWLAAHEPGLALRRAARAGAVALLAASILRGLSSGGYLADGAGNGAPVAGSFGYSAENITVTGLTHHRPEDVLSAIGVKAGQSLVWFSAEQARKNMERLSWVQSATIERRMPNQLLISVTERVPFAVWQTGSQYTVIDRSGVSMDGIGLDNLKGLPMITGKGANVAASALVDALQQVPDIMIRMHSASRIGERRWNIYLDNGLKIMLPDHDVPSSLRVLADADASMALLSKGIRAVDLRDPARLVITRAGPPQGAARELMTGSTSKAPQ